jgi:hypothetical protein
LTIGKLAGPTRVGCPLKSSAAEPSKLESLKDWLIRPNGKVHLKSSMTKMTRDELIAVLRALERKGMIESRNFADGEVRWRITAKGLAVRDGDAEWPEDGRYGLDS